MNIEQIIKYLLQTTTYSKDYILSLNENKLIHIYQRIKKAIPLYRQEIIEYQNNNNTHKYQENIINQMTYNELVKLRQKYGISHKNKIKQQSTPLNKTLTQKFEDYSYITKDEAFQIFGPSFIEMTDEEFKQYGYIIYECGIEPSTYQTKIENLKEEMINYIIANKAKKNNGKLYTKEELTKKEYTNLCLIYKKTKTTKEEKDTNTLTLKKA